MPSKKRWARNNGRLTKCAPHNHDEDNYLRRRFDKLRTSAAISADR